MLTAFIEGTQNIKKDIVIEYFKNDGYRHDGKVNALLWAEVISRTFDSTFNGANPKESKLATWFGGLQAIKGLFSFAAAKESINNKKYVHAGYELFFWGGDAIKKGMEASEYPASSSLRILVDATRNLGALAGVLSSYEEVKEAWENLTTDESITTTSPKHKVTSKEMKNVCEYLRITGAVFLLSWTALQLVGKEFKGIETALTAMRVAYSIMDVSHFVIENSNKTSNVDAFSSISNPALKSSNKQNEKELELGRSPEINSMGTFSTSMPTNPANTSVSRKSSLVLDSVPPSADNSPTHQQQSGPAVDNNSTTQPLSSDLYTDTTKTNQDSSCSAVLVDQ